MIRKYKTKEREFVFEIEIGHSSALDLTSSQIKVVPIHRVVLRANGREVETFATTDNLENEIMYLMSDRSVNQHVEQRSPIEIMDAIFT